jgi:hypothetical protein
MRGDKSQRAAVFERERRTVQAICKQNLLPKQILQQNAHAIAIQRFEVQVEATRAGPRSIDE